MPCVTLHSFLCNDFVTAMSSIYRSIPLATTNVILLDHYGQLQIFLACRVGHSLKGLPLIGKLKLIKSLEFSLDSSAIKLMFSNYTLCKLCSVIILYANFRWPSLANKCHSIIYILP
jgi:hypothetical protein